MSRRPSPHLQSHLNHLPTTDNSTDPTPPFRRRFKDVHRFVFRSSNPELESPSDSDSDYTLSSSPDHLEEDDLASTTSSLSSLSSSTRFPSSPAPSSAPPQPTSPEGSSQASRASRASANYSQSDSPLTADFMADIAELEQRRSYVPATQEDLIEVREQHALICSSEKVMGLSVEKVLQRLQKNEADLKQLEEGPQWLSDVQREEQAAERRWLISSVRLLKMDLDEKYEQLQNERRALRAVMRRKLDIQNELRLQARARDVHGQAQRRSFSNEVEGKRDGGDKQERRMLSCPICLEEIIRERSDAQALPCAHVFHEECVNGWLQRDNRCPVCLMTVQW